MSIDSELARLRAGLDRRERQALELCPGREPSNAKWRADSIALTALGDRKMADFVADHSPADVLRTVEAIRAGIAERDRLTTAIEECTGVGSGQTRDYLEARQEGIEVVLSLLADAYPDPTQES